MVITKTNQTPLYRKKNLYKELRQKSHLDTTWFNLYFWYEGRFKVK